MIRVKKAEEQTHRDTFDLQLTETGGERLHLVNVESLLHLAAVVDPFGDLEAQRPRHHRLRMLVVDVVDRPRGTTESRDLQNITKSRGGNQRGFAPPALDERIGGDGAAM